MWQLPVPAADAAVAAEHTALEHDLLGQAAVLVAGNEAAAAAGEVRSGMHDLTMAIVLDTGLVRWSEPPCMRWGRGCGSCVSVIEMPKAHNE